MVVLPTEELARRARGVRLVVTDNDGVLTDGTVFVGASGEALLQYSRRDGLGFERLREAGIATAILTRETSPIVAHRAEKLQVTYLWMGVHDKAAAWAGFLALAGVLAHEVAYIGDDLNDLGVLHAVARAGGLACGPADCVELVKSSVHFLTRSSGGRGAFRDVAEWLLMVRGDQHL